MFMWLWKRHKMKRLSKLPRKRRLFEYEAEPVMDELLMRHQIHSYEIKSARINHHAPEELRGAEIEIMYYSRNQCEVRFVDASSDEPSFYLRTHLIDFFPLSKSSSTSIMEGDFVLLKNEIKSDDELKGVLGEEQDELLVIKIERNQEYPYWAYNRRNREFFRVRGSEIESTMKSIPYEIK